MHAISSCSSYPYRVKITLAVWFASWALAAMAGPSWWVARGVIDASKAPADYAVANQGQAKNLARKAFDEFQAKLPGGAGTTLNQLITAWGDTTHASDYAAISVGQLKTLAKPFYDRLAETGYRGVPLAAGQVYPWSGSMAVPADYAAANLGQLKYLFSFDLGGASGFFAFLPPLDGDIYTTVSALSFTGSIALAKSSRPSNSTLQPTPGEAFLWSQGAADVLLGALPNTVSTGGQFISADGAVVIGVSALDNTTHYPNFTYKQFRWTQSGGITEFVPMSGAADVSFVGLSDDGSTIGGSAIVNGSSTAFIWTAAGGGMPLGTLPGDTYSEAQDMTPDGSVVVGQSSQTQTPPYPVIHGFRWTAQTGMIDLGVLPGSGGNNNLRVSANGQVVTGTSFISSPYSEQAFRWTQQTGIVPLGYLPGDTSSTAVAISADGAIIGGTSRSSNTSEAFRWTPATGMVGLGYLPGGQYVGAVTHMSRDGRVILGYSDATFGEQVYILTDSGEVSVYLQPFVWTQQTGMRAVADLIAAAGTDLTGWTLNEKVIVSPDGTTLAGYAVNTSDAIRGWVLRLP